MVVPTLFLLLLIPSAAVLVALSAVAPPRIWRAAATLAVGIAVLRIASSLLGRWLLQSESGWLQIPAFALALADLPEAALASTLTDVPSASALLLGALTLVGTSVWVFAIAAVVSARR